MAAGVLTVTLCQQWWHDKGRLRSVGAIGCLPLNLSCWLDSVFYDESVALMNGTFELSRVKIRGRSEDPQNMQQCASLCSVYRMVISQEDDYCSLAAALDRIRCFTPTIDSIGRVFVFWQADGTISFIFLGSSRSVGRIFLGGRSIFIVFACLLPSFLFF